MWRIGLVAQGVEPQKKTNDPIVDIKARGSRADVSDVAKTDNEAAKVDSGFDRVLTEDEDNELRRLHYLSEMGLLSPRSNERLIELRLRDRRKRVREPREFGED